FLNDLRKAVMVPDFDGLSDFRKHLEHLTSDQARLLIAARLNDTIQDDIQKSEINRYIGNGMKSFLAEGNRTAREVLTYAASVFDRWRTPSNQSASGDVTSQPEDRFLENELNLREEAAMKRMTPDHLDDIIQGAVPALCHIWNRQCRETDGLFRPDVDMTLKCADKTTHISLCNQGSMTSLAARLRRLIQQVEAGQGIDNLILIRHAERRIPSGAKKVNSYIQALKQRGARWMTPSRETLSVLDALRSLLSEAKSGDLNNAGQPVLEKTVRDWVRKAASEPAWNFIESMFGNTPADIGIGAGILLKLIDILKSERVMWLSDAAKTLHQNPEALERLIQPGLHRIGVLEGPPPLLYDMGTL
ncbi:MAG: hypothetical protein WA151_23645, partial [Desulfatirhabdiaceae bacterium]